MWYLLAYRVLEGKGDWRPICYGTDATRIFAIADRLRKHFGISVIIQRFASQR